MVQRIVPGTPGWTPMNRTTIARKAMAVMTKLKVSVTSTPR